MCGGELVVWNDLRCDQLEVVGAGEQVYIMAIFAHYLEGINLLESSCRRTRYHPT
jgi:hypothetical protein